MLNIENNPQKDVTRTNLQCDISDFAVTTQVGMPYSYYDETIAA